MGNCKFSTDTAKKLGVNHQNDAGTIHIKKVIREEKDIQITNSLLVTLANGSPNENYTTQNKLGQGAYGSVWKVQHYTGLHRAMKKIRAGLFDETENKLQILNEINILKSLDHPYVIKIFEYYSFPDGYYIVTEYCEGGELYDEITKRGNFTEVVTAHIMFQVLCALNYCHSRNVLHRDLKPENILIDNFDLETGFYKIKLIDFGSAKIYTTNQNENKIVGSAYYIAPEVLAGKYNEKCDLWSCGVLLYVLLSGKIPFYGKDQSAVLKKVKKTKYDMKKSPFDKISTEAKDLISKLLEKNHHKRLSAYEALQHEWFRKLNIQSYFSHKDIDDNVIQHIKKYNPNKLQQIVLAFLIHNLSHINEIQEANKNFSKLNTKLDGRLTKDQLIQALSTMTITTEEENLNICGTFDKIDNNNNGYIEYEEFARAVVNKEIFLDDDMLSFAFKYLDKDKSGLICQRDLKYSLSILGETEIQDELIGKIIMNIDTTSSGTINFEDFKETMYKLSR